VIDGLTVAANEFALQPCLSLCGCDRIGVQLTQCKIETRQIGDPRPRVHAVENSSPDFGWVRELMMGEQFDACPDASSLNPDEGYINSIG
jgi:hypothetical protein